MARIKKYSPEQKLSSFQTFVVDENPNSDYFRITEFKDTFTGGKNGFLIEGSEYLKETTEIKIEILDVEGNPIFYEPAKGIPEYYEGISSLIAVYIYNDTPIGLGKITILGELKDYIDNDVKRTIPDTWKGTYNVKWERDFQINKILSNEDRVRFFKRPQINIDEINKPIFNNNANLVTQIGNVNGIPLAPTAGTSLTEFSLPTSYRLNVSNGSNWTGSIEGNSISFDSIDYNPIVLDVVSETEIIVSPPYAPNGIVAPFSNESYTTSFNYIEGVSDLATALTGSFAKISITDMKTVVGDAARVKVYRRSQSNLTDYEFVQEIQLESNELLRDIETTEANEISYGTFTQNVLSQYWMTSSNDISVELNTGFLYNSAKLNSTEGNYFLTEQSFPIQSGVEYTLDFNVKKGSVSPTDFLKVTLSGSLNGTPKSQTIVNVPSSNAILQKRNFTENIIADDFDDAKLYFEVDGVDWYVNNVSLKASQETSFSPDEITFIQQVPKTLQTETFDYRFEFYDINNNYIPVLVEDTKTFDGGNLNLFNKDITLTPNNLYFSFDSASAPANPLPPTTITFDVETTLVTGSITYTSGAYDEFGDLILSSEYVGGQYPGVLSGYETLSPTLTVADFTGSRDDITVQYIRFTGEVEGVSDDVVITRTQDGKGGVNFEIRPYRGTIIKNKDESTLEVQAIRIDGVNEIILRDNLPQNGFSDAKLKVQSGSDYILLSEAQSTGFIEGLTAGTTGSGELDYNAVFDRTSITGQLPLYLMDGTTEEDILTTLLLTDLQDGLGAGFVTFDVEQFNINPKEDITFTPQTASLAGNFYLRGTNESPISGTLKVFPSMSLDSALLPTYYMFFETGAFDSRISITATNSQNEIIDSGVPGDSVDYYTPIDSKQLTFNFTYVEDFTSESISVDKTIFVAPDGIGIEPVISNIDPITVNLNANQEGAVYDYSPLDTKFGFSQGEKKLKYGINNNITGPGSWRFSGGTTINISSKPNSGQRIDDYTWQVSHHNMPSESLVASWTRTFEIAPFYTSSNDDGTPKTYFESYTQRITKGVDGSDAIEIEVNPSVVSLQADENGTVFDYSTADTDILVKQGNLYLSYETSSLPGTYTVSATGSGIVVGNVSASSQYDLDFGDETVHYTNFSELEGGSGSVNYNFYVYPYSLTNGVAGVEETYTKKQIFSKTNEGTAARSVSLSTTTDVVNFDGDGVVTSPLGSIFLDATAYNVTASQTYYQFFRDGFAYSLVGTDNTFEIGSGDATSPGETATWSVRIRDGNATSPVVASSEVTIAGIKAGADNYQVFLTNPSPSVGVEVDGTTTLDTTGTQITALKGTTELTHVSTYSEETLDLIGEPIGTLGEFSASLHYVPTFITQPNLVIGNPASIDPITDWNSPQDNKSATLIYKVDIENGRATYFLSQSISTVFEGATGPGLVMRGEWTGSAEYLFNLQQKRRDAVVVQFDNGGENETHYFATTEDFVTSSTEPYSTEPVYIVSLEQGDIVTGGWEYLGMQDYFVAAKLAIFEESFVENTINVGKPTTSYDVNPQITIFGGNSEPYISIGQGTQGYGQEGVFIGVTEDGGPNGTAGTTGLLSIEDNTGNSYLRWDGYGLEVKSDDVLIETDNLTIDSQNEKISLGQATQGFQEEGIYIGKDNTDYTLSLRGTPDGGGAYNALEWDGDTLTIRGSIRQTAAGVVEPSLRGTWADGVDYYPSDLVQYIGETWSADTGHTSDISGNSTDGPPGTGPWTIAAGAGRNISLLADSYVIQYDEFGANPTPSSTINLIASSSNFIDGYFKFTGGTIATFTDETSFTDGLTANTDTAQISVPSTYFSTPLTFRVAVTEGTGDAEISDTITITALKSGADATPQYMITPLTGTQIKNSGGGIELQVQESSINGLSDVTTGNIKIYDGATILAAQTGVTDGGNGVEYNPIISASFITGTKILSLEDNSGNVLDTITLLDVTDGLGGGSFISSNLKTSRPAGLPTFTPTTLTATASFFDTSGTEYTSSVIITPSVSNGVDKMAVGTASGDTTNIIITADDGDGVAITLGGSSVATKDVVLTAVFTDPATSQTTTITETYYIVSDGADGLPSLTVINTNQAHTLPSSDLGVVSSYSDSGTKLSVYEGTGSLDYDGIGTSAGTWKINTSQSPSSTITIGSISDSTNDALVGNHSLMVTGTDAVSINYEIVGKRFNGDDFVIDTTQTLTKAKEGVAGTPAFVVQLSADANVISYAADGTTPSPSGTITLTADSQNFTDAYFKFTGDGLTDETTYIDGTSANQDTFSWTIPSTYSATPQTIRVGVSDGNQSEVASDTITIVSVKPGSDTTPQYMITPTSGGTQIKNNSGNIVLQVQESSVSGLSNISSGNIKLYKDDSSLLNASMSGITGDEYNPTIDENAINGTLILELRDSSDDSVLDTIALLDVTDGLGGGSFISPNLKSTRNPADNSFTPALLRATASFFDTSGTEYTSSIAITPSFSGGVDKMSVALASGDSEITITATDGDGTTMVQGVGADYATKDTVLTAVFTDPATGQTTTINETFYIISDGADGIDAITVINTNQSHTVPANADGTLESGALTNSGTTIQIFEGANELDFTTGTAGDGEYTITVSNTGTATLGGITGNGTDTATVADATDMSTDQILITYTIDGKRVDGTVFQTTTTQSITKAKEGVAGKVVSITSDSQVYVFDDSADTTAADDTIRIYINQQNLSGTIGTSDITITDALAGSITTPSLTGTVTDGTGEQYFDIVFNTSTGDITSKTQLPVSILVQKDSITDSTSLNKLEGGSSNAPMYFISPLDGTQIKNGAGTLSFEILESAPGALNTITTGNIKIFSGSNEITTYGGVTGTNYAPTIPASSISGSMLITLKDGSTTYDSIQLLDVTDGLGGGSFISSNLKSTRNPSDNSFLPNGLSATASFFDTSGTEYTQSVLITPSFSGGVDSMQVSSPSGDTTNITITADDGDGTSITLAGSSVATKDVVLTAVFTDPATSQTNTITETYYIISDGADGIDAITVINTNQAHSVASDSDGSNPVLTNSGTSIKVFEGTNELDFTTDSTAGNEEYTITVSNTGTATLGGITGDGTDTATVGDATAMSTDQVVITYTISGKRLSGEVFTSETIQTLTKSKAGTDGTDGETGASVNIIFIRNATQPTTPSPSSGVPTGWSDSPPSGTNLLWAAQGIKGVGDTNFTWGTPYQVEGTAVAETTIYRLNDNTGLYPSGSYNFTTSTLTPPTNWSTTVPALASNGDAVYAANGLFSGAPTETAATTTWSTPVVYAQRTDGADGVDGTDAKTIRLSATHQAFVVAKNGTITPSTITFTANRQNISTSTTFTPTPSVSLFGSGDSRTLSSTDFGANTVVTIEASADGLSDEITIVKVAEGSDAITIILSNESHTFQADSSGTISDYTNSGTDITLYEGATQLDYDGSGTTAGHWTVSATPTNITAGSISDGGNNATVGNHSNMTANQASISYTITGKKLNGDSFSFTKIQSFTKSVAGTDGTDGVDGVDGVDGAPGTSAGIVYRGEWAVGVEYYKTTARIDVVKGSDDSYYMAKQTYTSDAGSKPTTGGSYTTYWDSFGAEFTSVATDILFADDVYADQTINVGSSGSDAVIALNADAGNGNANPFISIGQSPQGFESDGIFIGFDEGTASLSLAGDNVKTNIGGWEVDKSGLFYETDYSIGDLIEAEFYFTSSQTGGGLYQWFQYATTPKEGDVKTDFPYYSMGSPTGTPPTFSDRVFTRTPDPFGSGSTVTVYGQITTTHVLNGLSVNNSTDNAVYTIEGPALYADSSSIDFQTYLTSSYDLSAGGAGSTKADIIWASGTDFIEAFQTATPTPISWADVANTASFFDQNYVGIPDHAPHTNAYVLATNVYDENDNFVSSSLALKLVSPEPFNPGTDSQLQVDRTNNGPTLVLAKNGQDSSHKFTLYTIHKGTEDLTATSVGTVTAGSLGERIITGDAIRLSTSGSSTGTNKPFISIGQPSAGYDNRGAFLGFPSASEIPHFSLRSPSGDFLRYDGASVQFSGDFNGGTIEESAIVGGSISVPESGEGAKFSVDVNGNVSASNASIGGIINAESGRIGDWVIDVDTKALRDDNSEIVFEPNIPELQFFTGSEKKVVIGTKSELTDTAGGAGFTMEFSNTTHATPDSPTSLSVQQSNSATFAFSGFSVGGVTNAATTSSAVAVGDIQLELNVPALTLKPPTQKISQTTSYPSYLPTFTGQTHGNVVGPTAIRQIAYLYLEVVDADNSNAVIGRTKIAQTSEARSATAGVGNYYTGTYVPPSGGGGGGLSSEISSVVGDTKITLSDGSYILAKDAKIGDKILSWNWNDKLDSHTGIDKFGEFTIDAIKRRTTTEIYKLTIGDKVIEVSDSHGFWLDNNEEIKTTELVEGESKVYVKDGDSISLQLVNKIELLEGADVYTFSVAGVYNYISNDILSHNVITTGWTYVATSQGGIDADDGVVLAQSGSNVTINITTAATNAKLRYSVKLGTTAGYSQNTTSNGTTSNSYTTATAKYENNTNIPTSTTGFLQAFGSSLDTSLEFSIPSNFVEIQAGGLQVVSDEDTFVRAKRLPENIDKGSFTFGPEIFNAQGGASYFSGLAITFGQSTFYGTSIISRGTVIPFTDNLYDLGRSDQRWDDIFATNGIIQTSDETQKENIVTSDLGLDFINALNPVSYRFISGSRTHYGLGAQSVETTLESFEKESMDFAGLITGSNYGLRYHEFISPMIKAIQELTDKVTQLEAQISGSNT